MRSGLCDWQDCQKDRAILLWDLDTHKTEVALWGFRNNIRITFDTGYAMHLGVGDLFPPFYCYIPVAYRPFLPKEGHLFSEVTVFVSRVSPQFELFKQLTTLYARWQNCEKRLLASSCLSVCPSVRPSVRLHGTSQLPPKESSRNFRFEFFSKICRENSRFSKTWQE